MDRGDTGVTPAYRWAQQKPSPPQLKPVNQPQGRGITPGVRRQTITTDLRHQIIQAKLDGVAQIVIQAHGGHAGFRPDVSFPQVNGTVARHQFPGAAGTLWLDALELAPLVGALVLGQQQACLDIAPGKPPPFAACKTHLLSHDFCCHGQPMELPTGLHTRKPAFTGLKAGTANHVVSAEHLGLILDLEFLLSMLSPGCRCTDVEYLIFRADGSAGNPGSDSAAVFRFTLIAEYTQRPG